MINSHPLPFGQWFLECHSEVLAVRRGEAQECCRALQQGPLKGQEIDKKNRIKKPHQTLS